VGLLAPIKSKDFEKFLVHVGCTFSRQKGSHKAYWRSGLIRPLIIVEGKLLETGVIRKNLRALGISDEQYLEILKSL